MQSTRIISTAAIAPWAREFRTLCARRSADERRATVRQNVVAPPSDAPDLGRAVAGKWASNASCDNTHCRV